MSLWPAQHPAIDASFLQDLSRHCELPQFCVATNLRQQRDAKVFLADHPLGKCACLVQALRIDLTNLSERCGRVNEQFAPNMLITNEVDPIQVIERDAQFGPLLDVE